MHECIISYFVYCLWVLYMLNLQGHPLPVCIPKSPLSKPRLSSFHGKHAKGGGLAMMTFSKRDYNFYSKIERLEKRMQKRTTMMNVCKAVSYAYNFMHVYMINIYMHYVYYALSYLLIEERNDLKKTIDSTPPYMLHLLVSRPAEA